MDEKSLEAQGLVADRKSVVLDWTSHLDRRMRKYSKLEASGKCVEDDEYWV